MNYATPVKPRGIGSLRKGSLVVVTDAEGNLSVEEVEHLDFSVDKQTLWVKFKDRPSQPVSTHEEWLFA